MREQKEVEKELALSDKNNNRLKKELCGKQKAGRYQDLRWLCSLVQQLEQEVALCQKQTKF